MMSILKRMIVLAAAMFLIACGGGGSAGSSLYGNGGGAGGGTGAGGPSIALALSSTTVTGANPATVTATVKDGTGAGVAGQVVEFRTVGGLGRFSSTSALTDPNGNASVSLQPATTATTGADQVVATTTVNATNVTATAGFQLTATQVTIASFTSDVTTLAAYGQANLTVILGGTAAGTPVNVALSSGCVTAVKATLTPLNVSTTTGSASFTYRDAGCGAINTADTLQASITGTAVTASLSLPLTSPTVSSITFASAVPTAIYLKGSGLNETSQVTFQVRDAAGNGLANQAVTLSLVTAAGGVTLDGGTVPVSKVSDSLGNVLVRINSGTVPTSVRVRATLIASNISTVSSSLAVAVGLPSQLNFSLSQLTRNIEGYDRDGTTNSYTIIASDRSGNPVPDGTSINFVTEGGQIGAIQFTQTGGTGLSSATTNFASSQPRPTDGRITVLAYSLGEKSFLDANGDNVYETGESLQDLGDVYLSRSFTQIYDPNLDQYISLTIPGVPSGTSACVAPASPVLTLDKSIPSVPNTCTGLAGQAYVRRAVETVFSTSTARPLWASKPTIQYVTTGSTCPKVTLQDLDPADPSGNSLASSDYYRFGVAGLYGLGPLGSVSFYASDANPVRLNPMAAGTQISVNASAGITVSVAGGTPVPNTSYASFATINYQFITASSGTMTVTFTSPSLLATSFTIPIDSNAVGAPLIPCP